MARHVYAVIRMLGGGSKLYRPRLQLFAVHKLLNGSYLRLKAPQLRVQSFMFLFGENIFIFRHAKPITTHGCSILPIIKHKKA